MNIKKNLVANFSSREGYKPELIVVHISAGSLTSMTNWFSTPGSQASAHYGVGKDGSILQYVEESNKAWHAGRVNNPSFKLYKPGINPNLYTIGIENEGQDLANATVEQMRSLCELIKDVAKRNNIPLDRDHIIGHFQIDAINRPYCPSKDHSVMDEIVTLLGAKEDTVEVPRRLLVEISNYL
jgi:N-acetyl-anhydromuramyl-L-alanine amidase AmpD